ncbi:hypothetical protein [Synechococcus sp. CCY 9618]|uniref:hypothetical protein n=1 Tax=Synechococcus sp. CCY 9618 TaxID=2815602 RepID=UPI001C23B088|nr:hypothetical protein [Synechococcus sp. CCY 9618]
MTTPTHPRPPAGAPERSRIRLDTNLRRWFARNLGLWRSRRTYFFAEDDEVLRVDMLLRIEIHAEPGEGEEGYRFTWWPQEEHGFFERKPWYQAEGTMEARLCGHQLQRSSSDLAGAPSVSQIRQIDEHTMAFHSHVDDWEVLEQIRIVDQDRYRSRAIHTWRHGVLELAEMHHEIRLEAAGEPIG